MQTAQDYLNQTASAAKHLFAGIDHYIQILRNAPTPALITDTPQSDAMLKSWATANHKEIEQSLEAQRKFFAEKHALATLCGSVLQIASMAIRLYSQNKSVPPEFATCIGANENAIRHCIGRRVRDVPIGLLIYAGRNQYNHLEEGKLREPNSTIFEMMATKHNYGAGIRDPAFDLRGNINWNLPSNVTSILGWRTYKAYETDMSQLLII
jgi:hypothetical protein